MNRGPKRPPPLRRGPNGLPPLKGGFSMLKRRFSKEYPTFFENFLFLGGGGGNRVRLRRKVISSVKNGGTPNFVKKKKGETPNFQKKFRVGRRARGSGRAWRKCSEVVHILYIYMGSRRAIYNNIAFSTSIFFISGQKITSGSRPCPRAYF